MLCRINLTGPIPIIEARRVIQPCLSGFCYFYHHARMVGLDQRRPQQDPVNIMLRLRRWLFREQRTHSIRSAAVRGLTGGVPRV